MKQAQLRRLKFACAAAACVALGAVIDSRFVRRPAPPPGAPNSVAPTSGGEAALDRVIPEVDLEAVPFQDALEVLHQATGARLIVLWGELDSAISPVPDRNAPVTFRARGATLSLVLSEIIRQAYGSGDPSDLFINYAPDGDSIVVSTHWDLSRRTLLVRAYDVRDLLSSGGTPPRQAGNSGATPPSEDVEALEQVLRETIAPESWDNTTGQAGRVSHAAGRLVVTQSWENHRLIAQLLSRLRRAQSAAVPAPAPTPDAKVWDEALRRYVSTDPGVAEAALARRIREVRLKDVPLRQAVASLGELAHVDLVGDWEAIARGGQRDDVTVSLDLRDVTLAEALRQTLEHCDAARRVTFGPDGGRVLITSRGDAGRLLVTRVYDVRDWLAAAARDFPPPPPPPPPPLPYTGSGRALFGGGVPTRPPPSHPIDYLIDAVMEHVDGDTWAVNGGGAGRVTALGGLLVVAQTWETEEKVADFLSALRADPARPRAVVAPPAQPIDSEPTTAPAVPADAGQTGRDGRTE